MAQDRQITPYDVAKGIDQGLGTADAQRSAAFDRLAVTRQAKDTSLRREHERLSLKYDSDHPRVQAIGNKVVNNQELRLQVAAETIRSKIAVPIVDADTWVLHGFVRNEARQGMPNLTVALFDSNGSRRNNLGHACTDGNGYFRIISKDINNVAGSAVYVRVLSAGGAVLYADKNPLLPKLGLSDYKEILITGDTAVCVPPAEPPTAASQSSDLWVVNGRVTTTEGQGVGNHIVSIFDKDFIFDDRLGQSQTDQNGYYTLTYRTADFRDLIERKPDIFLKVLNQEGKTLYTSKETVRFEAGRVEIINVVLAAGLVTAQGSGVFSAQTSTDVWVVKGQVRDMQGHALRGYLVTVYDKDFRSDDWLGSATTDDNGHYTISYRTQDFRDFFESKPDLYLQIKDPNGEIVYTSKGNIWFQAGRLETIDAVVGRGGTGK